MIKIKRITYLKEWNKEKKWYKTDIIYCKGDIYVCIIIDRIYNIHDKF